jgi:hypothetical protein
MDIANQLNSLSHFLSRFFDLQQSEIRLRVDDERRNVGILPEIFIFLKKCE